MFVGGVMYDGSEEVLCRGRECFLTIGIASTNRKRPYDTIKQPNWNVRTFDEANPGMQGSLASTWQAQAAC